MCLNRSECVTERFSKIKKMNCLLTARYVKIFCNLLKMINLFSLGVDKSTQA